MILNIKEKFVKAGIFNPNQLLLVGAIDTSNNYFNNVKHCGYKMSNEAFAAFWGFDYSMVKIEINNLVKMGILIPSNVESENKYSIDNEVLNKLALRQYVSMNGKYLNKGDTFSVCDYEYIVRKKDNEKGIIKAERVNTFETLAKQKEEELEQEMEIRRKAQ